MVEHERGNRHEEVVDYRAHRMTMLETTGQYDDSRWIAEPCRLFDCCQENDGAAAVIIVSAEKAKDMKQKPAYILAAAQGSDHRCGAPVMNASNFPSSSFASLAPRLYEMAGIGPKDVDVVQSYENFTIGVMMAVVEFVH